MKTSDTQKGILCILAAAFGFALMSVFVRLSGDLPTMQKAFFRNFVALIIAGVSLARTSGSFRLPKAAWSDQLFRCIFGTSGMIANFYAVDRIGIADANLLNKLSPFWAILLSIPILKEKPGKVDIICTIGAFAGALLVIRPTGVVSETMPALIGLYGGFGAGTAYVFVRRLSGKGIKTPIIVFYFSLFSCLITLPWMVFDHHPMTLQQWIYLLLAGVSASLGQFGITTAYRYAPAKEISVFDYTQIVFAAILGVFIFAETPVFLSIVGYAVIIGIAVFRWLRQKEG